MVQVDEKPPNLKRGLPAKRLSADGARVAITYAKDAIAASAAVKAIELGGGKAILPEYLRDFCRFGYLTGCRKGKGFCCRREVRSVTELRSRRIERFLEQELQTNLEISRIGRGFLGHLSERACCRS